MTRKAGIVEELGEEALLLPALVVQALVANERAKYCFSLLQAARQRAESPGRLHPVLRAEREAAGIADAALDAVVPGAVRVGEGRYRVPELDRILGEAQRAVDEMVRPLAIAGSPDADRFASRRDALAAALRCESSGEIDRAGIRAITSGDPSAGDSPHLLVMDLHRALAALVAGLAGETIDGAQAYRLGDGDRALVAAFMRGLNRTAPLRFGHPGLETTAIRTGDRLLLQNEIGVTGAHVLVVSVAGTAVTVTYTDVHPARLAFFGSLLGEWGVAWSEPVARPAPGSHDGEVYHLAMGRLEASGPDRCGAFLEHLGSRIVFLIDWNKARRHLRAFLSDGDAVAVLRRAAEDGVGHRAFLELGGADLVDGALALAAPGLRHLGPEEAVGCLGRVLALGAGGLLRGEPRPSVADRCQAEVLGALAAARLQRLAQCAAHAALVVQAALALRESVAALQSGADEVQANAALARRREREGDRLVRLLGGGPFSGMVGAQDAALDALEEGCAYAALLDIGHPLPDEVGEMARLALSAGSAYSRALTAAAHGAEPASLADADLVVALGRECDGVRLRAEEHLATDGGRPEIRIGLVRAIATSTAALTTAVAVLRDGA